MLEYDPILGEDPEKFYYTTQDEWDETTTRRQRELSNVARMIRGEGERAQQPCLNCRRSEIEDDCWVWKASIGTSTPVKRCGSCHLRHKACSYDEEVSYKGLRVSSPEDDDEIPVARPGPSPRRDSELDAPPDPIMSAQGAHPRASAAATRPRSSLPLQNTRISSVPVVKDAVDTPQSATSSATLSESQLRFIASCDRALDILRKRQTLVDESTPKAQDYMRRVEESAGPIFKQFRMQIWAEYTGTDGSDAAKRGPQCGKSVSGMIRELKVLCDMNPLNDERLARMGQAVDQFVEEFSEHVWEAHLRNLCGVPREA